MGKNHAEEKGTVLARDASNAIRRFQRFECRQVGDGALGQLPRRAIDRATGAVDEVAMPEDRVAKARERGGRRTHGGLRGAGQGEEICEYGRARICMRWVFRVLVPRVHQRLSAVAKLGVMSLE